MTNSKLKFGDVLILIVCVSLFSASITGCALLSKTATQEQKQADVERLSYAAASIGAQEALLARPEWRARFLAAEMNLDVLVTSRTITGALLRNVIAALPVNELKSPQARIAIEAATILFDQSVGTSVNIEAQPYVLAAATGIRNGLRAALGLPVPLATRSERGVTHAPPPLPSIPFAPALPL